MARFVVDLGGVKMSEKSEAQLADEIQKTVLAHVAELDLPTPVALRFPREWWGIILHPDFEGLPGLEKDIGGFAHHG